MTPITQHEIEAMTIREAESRLALLKKGDAIAEQIRRAFAGVRLGDGVGLQEAQGLDDYADAAALARYRAGDEKDRWESLTVEALRRCSSSLSFFDANGMRFHLPAFMIADLRGEYGYGMAFCLTHLSDHSVAQFASLNPVQREAVRAFLYHILDDPDYQFSRPDIERALREYWIESDSVTARTKKPNKSLETNRR